MSYFSHKVFVHSVLNSHHMMCINFLVDKSWQALRHLILYSKKSVYVYTLFLFYFLLFFPIPPLFQAPYFLDRPQKETLFEWKLLRFLGLTLLLSPTTAFICLKILNRRSYMSLDLHSCPSLGLGKNTLFECKFNEAVRRGRV